MIEEDFLAHLLVDNQIASFSELFFEISQTNIKNVRTSKKKKLEQIKLLSFVYMKIMEFPTQNLDNKTLVSKKFFESVLNLLFGDVAMHHSHIDG